MSFIANTMFEARITNNDRDNLSHIAGRFKSGSADADCSAGLLCVRVSRTSCEGFAGVSNENTWVMNAAAATDNIDSVIYACDTYDCQLLTSANGNKYYIGAETLGLGVPAGMNGNFTKVVFDGQHEYRFGTGNLSAAVSTNTFFTIADGKLVPAAAAPTAAGSIYFKLLGTGSATVGASAGMTYYDVQACRVSVGE